MSERDATRDRYNAATEALRSAYDGVMAAARALGQALMSEPPTVDLNPELAAYDAAVVGYQDALGATLGARHEFGAALDQDLGLAPGTVESGWSGSPTDPTGGYTGLGDPGMASERGEGAAGLGDDSGGRDAGSAGDAGTGTGAESGSGYV